MRRSTIRRTGAAVAAVTSLALALTACGGTTKSDVKKESGGAAAPAGAADPTRPPRRG
ncbi:Rhamnose ABC transporter substrate-binding protein OS=Streptomyces microflavus OX=1919 GN=rhaS PE=4 SV=1 [Streptomyces microflavus]